MNASFELMVAAPVVLAMGFLLAVTLFYNQRERGRRLRGRRRRAPIYRCSGCGHVYEDPRHVPLAGCPRCGTLNEAVRR